MAADAEKLDLLFKDFKGVGFSSDTKQSYEEQVNSLQYYNPSQHWVLYKQVPTTAPGASVSGLITYYTAGTVLTTSAVGGTDNSFQNAGLVNAILETFNSSYAPVVYENDGTTVIPYTQYIINPKTGILTFWDLPAGVSSGSPPKVQCHQYIGPLGTSEFTTFTVTAANTFAAGESAYFNGTVWAKAIASAESTRGTHLIASASSTTFTLTNAGVLTIPGKQWITTDGFTAGDYLYTSDTVAGALTATAPGISNLMAQVISDEVINIFPFGSGGSGGGSATDASVVTSDIVQAGLAIGSVVRFNGTNWVNAQANDEDTLGVHIVVSGSGTSWTLASHGKVTISGYDFTNGGAFALGDWLYISESVAGGLTNTQPVISAPVGFIESAETLRLNFFRAAITAGATENTNGTTVFTVTQATHGLTAGDIVYNNGSGWLRAIATTADTIGTHIVSAVIDTDNFVLASDGFINISTFDFTSNVDTDTSNSVGDWLYLSSANAGKLTNVAPALTVPVGFVNSSTSIHLRFLAPRETTGTGSGSLIFFVEQNGHGFSAGQLLYRSGGGWALADNSTSATLATHLITSVINTDLFNAAMIGIYTISGASFGSAGTVLYLGSTPGAVALSAPGTGLIQRVGFADDSETINFTPHGLISGDVNGPASSTDNAIVTYDGTGGKLIKNTSVVVPDGETAIQLASAAAPGVTTNKLYNDSAFGLMFNGLFLQPSQIIIGRGTSTGSTASDCAPSITGGSTIEATTTPNFATFRSFELHMTLVSVADTQVSLTLIKNGAFVAGTEGAALSLQRGSALDKFDTGAIIAGKNASGSNSLQNNVGTTVIVKWNHHPGNNTRTDLRSTVEFTAVLVGQSKTETISYVNFDATPVSTDTFGGFRISAAANITTSWIMYGNLA